MTTKNFSNQSTTLRVMTAAFLTLLLGAFYPGVVSNLKAQTPKKAETPTKASAASESGGQKEGIKVHGHWTIDVRNPDGTLVTHREFENSLAASGTLSLASF